MTTIRTVLLVLLSFAVIPALITACTKDSETGDSQSETGL
jgi:hypothetical protein